jgi:glycosyltransferase involved in cell wall biosynthesis
MAHNFYRLRGGECAVFDAECALLRDAGHEVVPFTRHSDAIAQESGLRRLTLPLRSIWSTESREQLAAVLAREAPDVAHFTNTFPLISPSAYAACAAAGVAVVQTLHNFRWLCPAATFFRDGQICEECVDHSLLRGVAHGCYRDSRAATAVVAGMIAANRERTLLRHVDRFIALTQFAHGKFVANGFPDDRVRVKPNFLEPDPALEVPSGGGDYALFAGRLDVEKGLDTLLDAWKRLPAPHALRIAGEGPLRAGLEARIRDEQLDGVELLGRLERESLIQALRGARTLVFPSVWYEGMPMALIEAFACGVPPIASRLGGMAEMIDDGRNGLLFEPGNAEDLAERVEQVWSDEAARTRMAAAARAEYETHHRAPSNLERLLEIYREAIASRRAR